MFQPLRRSQRQRHGASTSDLVALQKRPRVGLHDRPALASENVSLSASQVKPSGRCRHDGCREARQTELATSDLVLRRPPYLTGYAIKVVDDSGEYGPAASMWRAPVPAIT